MTVGDMVIQHHAVALAKHSHGGWKLTSCVGTCICCLMQPDALYQKLRASAQDMFISSPAGKDQPTAGPDRYTGYGFLNAQSALVS
jgi:hypothetical protein